jgi:hypothetical protein
MCKEKGVKVVISTDAHHTRHLAFIRYGVTMARRGWLEKKDVINTLPVNEFLAALRPKPAASQASAKPSPSASVLTSPKAGERKKAASKK